MKRKSLNGLVRLVLLSLIGTTIGYGTWVKSITSPGTEDDTTLRTWLSPRPAQASSAVAPLEQGQNVITPLEASGLTPLWAENFTDSGLDRMQYTWAKGQNSALRSFVMPGAVYFGKEGNPDWPWVEQEINNFKAYSGEPLPNTIEFDVFSPNTGQGRVSLRPRRRGDFAHIMLGLSDDKTNVNFRFNDFQEGTTINYAELTGPTRGWTHIVASYRQYEVNGLLYAQYVLAVNEEIHEFSGPSGITNPDWATYWATTTAADGWSIEHTSSLELMGKYIANIRAYNGFVDFAQMNSRLQGRVNTYRAQLPDPRNYNGPKRAFQVHKDLDLHGPNAMAYWQQVEPLKIKFDGSLSSSWAKIATYQWDFGDGQTGSGPQLTHVYSQPGSYPAQLKVTNKYGSEIHRITVIVTTSTDSTPPLLAAVNPVDEATNVALDQPIVVDFSEPMNPNTIQAKITPTLSVTQVWSLNNTRLTLTHDGFKAGKTYTVQIGGKDIAGNSLESGAVVNPWQFSSRVNPAPQSNTLYLPFIVKEN